MKKELSDRFLRSLKPDAERRIEISDTKCTGLRFRLSPQGRATWVFEKRIRGGPKRKFTFGRWPEPISLSKARAMAVEILAEASRGVDRVAEAKANAQQKEVEKARRVSCRTVLDAYRQLHLNSLRTGDERYRQISTALRPMLDVPISELRRRDLQGAVDLKAESGRRAYANRVRAALVAFSNWAFVRGYIEEPIGVGVAKATRETPRERVLSIPEVRKICAATLHMGELWGPFFRLLILTGQRRGEIARLQWSEVDFERRLIIKPGSETKNGKPNRTHLSDPSLHELTTLRSKCQGRGHVFTFDGRRPVANPSHAKARLDAFLEGDVEDWRIHDLRTAMATALAEVGEPEATIDRILNHSATGSAPSAVARVYNQSEQLSQRARALDRWAQIVLGKNEEAMAMGKE